jgi:anti-sigma factor RsiW
MSCSPFDLRDYFLKEIARPQALLVEEHVRECRRCQEELDRLRLTQAALFALREEELPQRIAFVSDAASEPSAWRRRWAGFWGNGARLGFASVAMLSIAILVSALTRPAPAPAGKPPAIAASFTPEQVQAQIQAAVQKAVRESEERQTEKMNDLLVRERDYSIKLARAADLIQYLDRDSSTRRFFQAGYRNQDLGRAQ